MNKTTKITLLVTLLTLVTLSVYGANRADKNMYQEISTPRITQDQINRARYSQIYAEVNCVVTYNENGCWVDFLTDEHRRIISGLQHEGRSVREITNVIARREGINPTTASRR